ncbi:MAG: hypothetical protein JSV20_04230 [Candidatus Bathyarchaeota archaeon]|nr:MAG: hypothetical protein JSV20_04230 [Candidatus Bathyarchaeota archaeon]
MSSSKYCAKCGTKLELDGAFCPSCGTPVTPSARAPPSAPSPTQRRARPGGITLLTILEGLVSFVMLFGGAALLVLSAFLGAGGWELIPEEALQQLANAFAGVPIIALTTAFLTGIGIVLLILAILGFIMTWGLWSGKSWARTITKILDIISIVTGIFSLPGRLISILINIGILYYLTRPHIQAYYR